MLDPWFREPDIEAVQASEADPCEDPKDFEGADDPEDPEEAAAESQAVTVVVVLLRKTNG